MPKKWTRYLGRKRVLIHGIKYHIYGVKKSKFWTHISKTMVSWFRIRCLVDIKYEIKWDHLIGKDVFFLGSSTSLSKNRQTTINITECLILLSKICGVYQTQNTAKKSLLFSYSILKSKTNDHILRYYNRTTEFFFWPSGEYWVRWRSLPDRYLDLPHYFEIEEW